jgi:hypothetical protein
VWKYPRVLQRLQLREHRLQVPVDDFSHLETLSFSQKNLHACFNLWELQILADHEFELLPLNFRPQR